MFKLLAIDNPSSAGNDFVGTTYDFYFNGTIFVFGNLRSSKVSKIEKDDDFMKVITKNSIYEFKRI